MFTGDSARGADNLLVLLYQLAHRQQENFTTDSFAHLLQHLVVQEPLAAEQLLDWLTGSDLFSTRDSDQPLWIHTQAYTEEHGIPDLRIDADDLCVIVEVKLGSWLTLGQVEPYAKELARSGRPARALVGLTGYKPPNPLSDGERERTWDDLGLVVRTWGELGSRLLVETTCPKSPVTTYLVDQFIGLLNYLHLMPFRVRSPLSEELQAHREWAEKNPEQPAVTRTRLNSLERLAVMQHTDDLRNLLLQMRSVLDGAPDVTSCRFDSGPGMAEPWIGFNFNGMAYFFYVPLGQPERITLQRYGGFDSRSFDGSLGVLQPPAPGRPTRWRCTLDLSEDEGRFFSLVEVEQEKMLSDFFGEAFGFAERLLPESPAGGDRD